jgi:hypothetical protein
LAVGPDGWRLLVPFAPDRHRQFRPDRRSSTLQLGVLPVELAGVRSHCLDVVCTSKDLRWLFSSFVADVLARIDAQPDVDPVAIVRACFDGWRTMFATGGRELSLRALAGLFGELVVLERALKVDPYATTTWVGPDRARHDFEGDSMHVEVKTTLSDDDRTVTVHGFRQLETDTEFELRLAHVRVDGPVEDGESVPDFADRLRKLDRTGRLTQSLMRAGLRPADRSRYEDIRFAVVEEEWYPVGVGFPRIVPDDLPAGIDVAALSAVTYAVDLERVTAEPARGGDIDVLVDRLVG